MMSRMLVILSSTVMVGCAVFSSNSNEPPPLPEAPVEQAVLEKFNSGLRALERERYKEAAEIFDKILVEHPTSEFELVTLYNSGAAYDGMGDCRTAGRRYRQLTRTSMGQFKRLEAQAFLRLSYAYECVGNNRMTIASLIDTMKRRDVLPEEMAQAEVPARLAAAYARSGNLVEAENYFAQAQRGLQVVQAKYKDSRKQQDILARTLFFMGKLNQDEVNLKVKEQTFFTNLRYLQPYLLKSVEMNSDEWSPRAAEQLKAAYNNVWTLLRKARSKSSTTSSHEARVVKKKQEEMAKQALQNIRELKEIRFPEKSPSTVVSSLFTHINNQERRLQSFLASNVQDLPLTKEAQKRQGLKRSLETEPVSPGSPE